MKSEVIHVWELGGDRVTEFDTHRLIAKLFLLSIPVAINKYVRERIANEGREVPAKNLQKLITMKSATKRHLRRFVKRWLVKRS